MFWVKAFIHWFQEPLHQNKKPSSNPKWWRILFFHSTKGCFLFHLINSQCAAHPSSIGTGRIVFFPLSILSYVVVFLLFLQNRFLGAALVTEGWGESVPSQTGVGSKSGVLSQGADSLMGQLGAKDSTQLAWDAAAEGGVNPGVRAAV